MMRRGYSRDHRPDCEPMVIARIVNSEGFPFSDETFDGHRADVSTRETILRLVERQYGKARRIGVFARGIVSQENLAAIRKRGGQSLAGAPPSQRKQFEAERLKDDGTEVRRISPALAVPDPIRAPGRAKPLSAHSGDPETVAVKT
jgi:transposase